MTYKGDIIYIEQVLKGNINAFSHIVDHHKDRAYNLAIRICGSPEDAEEVTQDAFLKAFRSLHGFQMKSSFSTWLYRIVYNSAISHVRSRKKGVLSIEDFPAEAADFSAGNISEEEAEKEYRKSLVNFALQKIDEDDRGLITLYYYDEMDIDEIAGVTGLSKTSIKVRLFRARRKMMEVIEKAEKKQIA